MNEVFLLIKKHLIFLEIGILIIRSIEQKDLVDVIRGYFNKLLESDFPF